MNINILRLKTGEDIISFVEKERNNVILTNPLSIILNYNYKHKEQELILTNWLPHNLIEERTISLPIKEVLLILTPKKEFKEYYLNFLKDFKFDTKDEEKQLLKNILETLDSKYFNKIH